MSQVAECAICEEEYDLAEAGQNVNYGFCFPVSRFYPGSDVHKVLERSQFICGDCFYDVTEEQHNADRRATGKET